MHPSGYTTAIPCIVQLWQGVLEHPVHPSGYATAVLDAQLGTSSYEGPDDSM